MSCQGPPGPSTRLSPRWTLLGFDEGLDGNRRLHRELADEYTGPRIEALERRLAELEGQVAQHGELEAGAVSTATPTATASEASAESIRARARRFMFGDTDPAEIERLLEQDEDDGEDDD